ncbi:MAG TPA: DNA translocase FtsK 4TM domain-containing protein, partial [Burkholderiales bacterium]
MLLIAAGVYLLLILATYQRSDPGWSHSATAAATRNAGGAFGAWLSDRMLFLFGLSAYWWVALCLYLVVWGWRRMDGFRLGAALGGFALLLVCSAALERLRLHSLPAELPLAPGGVTGEVLADVLSRGLGFTGATLALLTLGAIGWSLFIGVSWLAIFEALGTALEKGYVSARGVWERRRDRKLGSRAREAREVVVQTEKKREEDHPPLRIEPPVAEIRKSERAQKEKQAPLFDHLPDTPLPPLKLLDEAKQSGETITAETLEFTSRLIEKKLSDFGVAVKVLAAYPGPVITRYEIEPAVGVKGSQIVNLVKDLARALSVVSIRVVETI